MLPISRHVHVLVLFAIQDPPLFLRDNQLRLPRDHWSPGLQQFLVLGHFRSETTFTSSVDSWNAWISLAGHDKTLLHSGGAVFRSAGRHGDTIRHTRRQNFAQLARPCFFTVLHRCPRWPVVFIDASMGLLAEHAWVLSLTSRHSVVSLTTPWTLHGSMEMQETLSSSPSAQDVLTRTLTESKPTAVHVMDFSSASAVGGILPAVPHISKHLQL
ncbi:hypothetical protein B0O80DRAFT_471545 [Mortierella sp. GBAus27b]|nr:hypothetical protein B0O80DRAFT_471545 [Mortierella sp. GBAus27b]